MTVTLVVNFYGGPGSGKSTMAARVFSELKENGVNAELVTEYAKDLTWDESFNKRDNQIKVFGEQHHRIWRLRDQVDVIVTDSPLFNSVIYGETSDAFKLMVREEVAKFNNLDVWLWRVKPYNPAGRTQNEEHAKILDRQIRQAYLDLHQGGFDFEYEGRKESAWPIYTQIMARLQYNTITKLFDE